MNLTILNCTPGKDTVRSSWWERKKGRGGRDIRVGAWVIFMTSVGTSPNPGHQLPPSEECWDGLHRLVRVLFISAVHRTSITDGVSLFPSSCLDVACGWSSGWPVCVQSPAELHPKLWGQSLSLSLSTSGGWHKPAPTKWVAPNTQRMWMGSSQHGLLKDPAEVELGAVPLPWWHNAFALYWFFVFFFRQHGGLNSWMGRNLKRLSSESSSWTKWILLSEKRSLGPCGPLIWKNVCLWARTLSSINMKINAKSVFWGELFLLREL